MIYQRRALQRRLNELRHVLEGQAIDGLVKRLNKAGNDRVSAMWEVVVLHSLSKCGSIRYEVALASQKRPDILFERGVLRLITDVRSVSDAGLDENNPYSALIQLVERAKKKLKLPAGGIDLRVQHRYESTRRGTRTVLRLPPRGKLQEFVQKAIVPQLHEQIAAGQFPLHIVINDADIGLDITIDPAKSPFSSGSYAAYDIPTIKDRNPLYYALDEKARQLNGADGITGIIIGDGDCAALSDRPIGWNGVTPSQIVEEFFRQHKSVDFVLLLSVRASFLGLGYPTSPVYQNGMSLFVRSGCDACAELNTLFQTMMEYFPKPVMMPVNGALRARESNYNLGHHGGYNMSRNVVRLGLREFTEIFAGLRTLQNNSARYVNAAKTISQESNHWQAIILQNLKEGRLPATIEIIKTDEEDNDDWVEIHFGEIDPAIAPLR